MKGTKKTLKKRLHSQQFCVKAICFLGVVVMAVELALGVGCITGYRSMYAQTRQRAVVVNTINQIEFAVMYSGNMLKEYVITGDESALERLNELNLSTYYDESYTTLQSYELEESEMSGINTMIANAKKTYALQQNAISLVAEGKTDDAKDTAFSSEYSTSIQNAVSMRETLINTIGQRITENITGNSILITVTLVAMAVLILTMVAGFILLHAYVKKYVMKPVFIIKTELENFASGNLSSSFDLVPDDSEIGSLVNAIINSKSYLKKMIDEMTYILREIANGNVSFYINYEYKGEFAEIKAALNQILGEMNSDYASIRNAAQRVADGSEQVASGAAALSEGSAQQASAIQQLSSSIFTVAEMVKSNAESAREANDISNIAADALKVGNEEMQQMMEAMNDIEVKSNEIVKIIKTIEDIAFQTNILALNAAVEAATAGDAGKGFAVVADEVRNLAGKSAKAAKNTNKLINDSIKSVAQGTSIVRKTAETMREVLEKSKLSNEIITCIAESADQQANSVEQISIGIEQVSEVTQSNSATAEQSASASEEMSEQALTMSRLMTKYNLREE